MIPAPGPGRSRATARILLLAAAIFVAGVFARSVIAAIESGGPGGDPTAQYAHYVREARAALFCRAFEQNDAAHRSCLIGQFLRVIVQSGDPAHELPRIDLYARGAGGFLETNCHLLMHTVGRRYGRIEKVTLARLQHYLPRSNDPGCSAGFAHGLLTYLGPQIVKLGPRGAAADCHRAGTRYQRYSCIHGLGHAYARLFIDAIAPAIASCRQLGPNDAPDCAQGVYHDYWLALSGLDNTTRPTRTDTSPRSVCGSQPAEFVRACWYRAFLERPPKRPVDTARDLVSLCRGLHALQRSACITGASVISSGDPFDQIGICAALRGGEAVSCIRGVVVPSLARSPLREQVRLIARCSSLDPSARVGCYEWLGRTLNVVTNGRFGTVGCGKLIVPEARLACARGARAYEGPLETFS